MLSLIRQQFVKIKLDVGREIMERSDDLANLPGLESTLSSDCGLSGQWVVSEWSVSGL